MPGRKEGPGRLLPIVSRVNIFRSATLRVPPGAQLVESDRCGMINHDVPCQSAHVAGAEPAFRAHVQIIPAEFLGKLQRICKVVVHPNEDGIFWRVEHLPGCCSVGEGHLVASICLVRCRVALKGSDFKRDPSELLEIRFVLANICQNGLVLQPALLGDDKTVGENFLPLALDKGEFHGRLCVRHFSAPSSLEC